MRALLIPADDTQAIREVQIAGNECGGVLDALQAFVGGSIETIPHPTRADVAPYFNEEGKLIGLPANQRATRLLRESMFDGDHIAGDCVLAGFDPASGETVELPGDFDVPRAEAMDLGEPSEITRKDRSITYDWLVSANGDKRTLATLTVSHHRAGVNMLSGTQRLNEFTATLGNETEQPGYGSRLRSFRLFSGVRIDRQEVRRFSDRGLEAFAERALARLRELCAAGDERVMRYFAASDEAVVR
jgi:hypothetical protein